MKEIKQLERKKGRDKAELEERKGRRKTNVEGKKGRERKNKRKEGKGKCTRKREKKTS